MSKIDFFNLLNQELQRLDAAGISKRQEKIITGFACPPGCAPQAIILGKAYRVFNSNDYLGLRLHPALKKADHLATQKFGTGPGAVRFISGSLQIHRELEQAIAAFHNREDALIFSSAFAANLAVLGSLIKGQSADSLVSADTLVISDALNHRSIVDGIRVANLDKDHRTIFAHLDLSDLERILYKNSGKFTRCLIVTDGVFSMLGEYQNLHALNALISRFDAVFPQGILLYMDDAHGVGAFGDMGRGTEKVTGGHADILVGTFGKAFGADGGYVVGDHVLINYLREAAATYIYSNSLSPGTAAAALTAIKLVSGTAGKKLLLQLQKNITLFKQLAALAKLPFAVDSSHSIQPLLVGDPQKTAALCNRLLAQNILVTAINYPVVAKGRDEIRVQLSAAHTFADIRYFITAFSSAFSVTL